MSCEPEIQDQKEFYNNRWKGFTYPNVQKIRRCAEIMNAIGLIGRESPEILDFGCGSGWLTAILGVIGPTVGVDLSETAVAQATQRYPHARFIQADIRHFDYPAESFDVVVSQEVLEHLEDQESHLRAAHRLLRKGGHLILTMPNRSTALAGEPIDKAQLQPIENWLTVGELRSMLKTHFEIIHLTTIRPGCGSAGLYRIASSTRLRRLARSFGALTLFDAVTLRLGFGYHLFAVARKP